MRDDGAWPRRVPRERGADGLDVVPVDLLCLESKRPEFFSQRPEIGHLLGGPEPLQAIRVDDQTQRFQPVMLAEDQRLPIGSLVPLPVR